MKPLVIYHDNCADGFGAAFAAWTVLGDEAEYLPMQYDDKRTPFEFEIKNHEVYVLDFSFPRETMDRLFTNAKRVVWLDHHKTAFEMWCVKAPDLFFTIHKEADDQKHILLDDCKSGALLAWEYFHPGEEVPMLIKHIDDYDRWQFKLDGTKEFNKALWSYAPWTFTQWRDNFYDYPGTFGRAEDVVAEGAAILRAHDQNVQAVVKGSARKCELPLINTSVFAGQPRERFIGLAANCPPHLASDVGHELANQSGTYGLLWYISKDGKCLCSLRSNGNYDVSAIAKSFGGGGHKNAAGFEIDIQTLLGWLK